MPSWTMPATKIGLGDFRPDTKGVFGRFVVNHWTGIDLDD